MPELDMGEPAESAASDRPLVTFALFAYNQEKYIREAVEGAFAQTYEPLEIILSDDCSTDRTYEIMQEMAAAYEGPHRVVALQQSSNRGVLRHVLTVTQISRGEVIIVAAGDDISLPKRSAALLRQLSADNADVACSFFSQMNESGILTATGLPTSNIREERFLSGNPQIQQLHGATAAYRRSFLEQMPLPSMNVTHEDYVFSILATAMGRRFAIVNDELVRCRIHSSNVGASSRAFQRSDWLEQDRLYSLSLINALEYISNVLDSSPLLRSNCSFKVKSRYAKYLYLRSNWTDFKFFERLEFAWLCIGFSNPRLDLLRCLGKNMLKTVHSHFNNSRRSTSC